MEEPMYPEHVYAAFERLDRGETITVRHSREGFIFQVKGTRSREFPMIRLYTILRDGKVQRKYRGMTLGGKANVLDWLNNLEILEEKKEETPS